MLPDRVPTLRMENSPLISPRGSPSTLAPCPALLSYDLREGGKRTDLQLATLGEFSPGYTLTCPVFYPEPVGILDSVIAVFRPEKGTYTHT